MPSWVQIAGIAGIVLCMGIAGYGIATTTPECRDNMGIIWFWVLAGLIALAVW